MRYVTFITKNILFLIITMGNTDIDIYLKKLYLLAKIGEIFFI